MHDRDELPTIHGAFTPRHDPHHANTPEMLHPTGAQERERSPMPHAVRALALTLTLAALLYTVAVAQDASMAYAFTAVVADELDATIIDCPIDTDQPIACLESRGSPDLLRSELSSTLANFSDIDTITPWQLEDGVYTRAYTLQHGERPTLHHTFSVLVSEHSRDRSYAVLFAIHLGLFNDDGEAIEDTP